MLVLLPEGGNSSRARWEGRTFDVKEVEL